MSNIVTLLCSHRKEGKSSLVLETLSDCNNVDAVLFSDVSFEPCVQCAKCRNGHCVKYINDGFNDLVDKIKASGGFIVFSPLYSPIPSKLSVFLERLTSVSYFAQTLYNEELPLKMKNCSVIGYDSSGRNSDLEILIKRIIKPILAGYVQKDTVEEYKFVELNDFQTISSDNLIEYFYNTLKKMNLTESDINENRIKCNNA